MNNTINFIKEVMNGLQQLKELDVDATQIKSSMLKKTIVDLKVSKTDEILDKCEKAIEAFRNDETNAKKIAEQESHAMYFDILRADGSIDAHIFSLDGEPSLFNKEDKVLRIYNSRNVVQYESPNAACKCPNYNDVFNETLKKIKSLMKSENYGKLGITTSLNEYPGYTLPEEKFFTKEEIDAVELPEDEKLPKTFVENCLKFDDPKAKLTSNDLWKDAEASDKSDENFITSEQFFGNNSENATDKKNTKTQNKASKKRSTRSKKVRKASK